MSNRSFLAALLVVVAICSAATTCTAIAGGTDTVVLVNGNAITGKIKSLDFGSLQFSTDSMGTVKITWEDIVSIDSPQHLQVVTAGGDRFLATLQPADRNGFVKIVTVDDSSVVSSADIVGITPIDDAEQFLNRIEGDISFGLNAQKSAKVATVNLAVDLQYRTERYLAGLKAYSSANSRDDAETVKRQSLGLTFRQFRRDRWFTEWGAEWESNDEQGIESRILAGGAIGRYLRRSNSSQFSLTAGLVATQESLIGQSSSETNGEGRLQARYLSRSNDPKSSFSLTTTIFPLLEDPSQYRANTDMSFKREFIDDLFFEVLIYHSYLSEPPLGAENADYGVTTSLGYSF